MKKYLLYGILFLVSLFIVLTFIFYPRLKLIKPKIELNVNEKYKEPGYKAYNLLEKFDKKVKVNSNLNTKKIGEYKIKYSYKFLFIKASKIRTVNVVDKEKPIVKLEYENEEICRNKYKEYKYSATDNYDGDLTSKVKVELKENKLIYTVSDSSNNQTVLTKKIKIKTDNTPTIKLKGSSNIYIYKGNEYKEPGYEASDECDGNLTDKVRVEGSVDKNKLGTYKIKYTIYNSEERKKEVTRTINVINKPAAASATNGAGKVVYLTFDDGPGAYTKSILNTLAKYNVKATFFVTNQFPAYQYLITEEAKQGHAIAVHTYTHNYNVYTSVDTYINDFNKMNDIIKQRTGSTSNLFRFPGGSSNTISRKYKAGVVSAIAAEMTSRGYVYFDWNVSSGDAAGASSSGIYTNVVNGVSRCGSSCIVLMHDIKGTTASALDSILKELTSKGYSFSILTESSPTAHHTIAN